MKILDEFGGFRFCGVWGLGLTGGWGFRGRVKVWGCLHSGFRSGVWRHFWFALNPKSETLNST